MAIAKYPAFCGEVMSGSTDLLNSCKIELATLLAHIKHESINLQYTEEIACTTGSSTGTDKCDYSADSAIYPALTGQ